MEAVLAVLKYLDGAVYETIRQRDEEIVHKMRKANMGEFTLKDSCTNMEQVLSAVIEAGELPTLRIYFLHRNLFDAKNKQAIKSGLKVV